MIHVVLLAAPKGAGKTTASVRFAEQARDAGMRIGGILSPAKYDENGHKVGIDVRDASTGEERPLAVLESEPRRATVGQYRFVPKTMHWALERVMLALAAPIDVAIVDEIGPLELVKSGGFTPALDWLPSARATTAILVVRSELLTRLQEHLDALSPVTITLTKRNRQEVPVRLFEEVWGAVCRRWNEKRPNPKPPPARRPGA